jgi:hypothetical protein
VLHGVGAELAGGVEAALPRSPFPLSSELLVSSLDEEVVAQLSAEQTESKELIARLSRGVTHAAA